MNFLLNCGISKETLDKIKINNTEQTMLDAEWNMERVVSSLQYLNEIGINQINSILINRFDIVLRGRKSLENKINNLSIKDIVNKIDSLGRKAYYIPKFDDIIDFIKRNVKADDIILTQGAGTITDLGHKLVGK